MTWEVSCGHFWSYCPKIRFHMNKGKGQKVTKNNLFPLEFQLPDRKDTLQPAQKCYQLRGRHL